MYHHRGYTSINWPLSYPFKSMKIRQFIKLGQFLSIKCEKNVFNQTPNLTFLYVFTKHGLKLGNSELQIKSDSINFFLNRFLKLYFMDFCYKEVNQ